MRKQATDKPKTLSVVLLWPGPRRHETRENGTRVFKMSILKTRERASFSGLACRCEESCSRACGRSNLSESR